MAPKAKPSDKNRDKQKGLEVFRKFAADLFGGGIKWTCEYESAMRNNFSSLEYSRTCQAAASGMAAGILGLTGIPGFIFYFITVAIQALFWEAKAGFEWRSYFLDRTLSVTHSIVGGLFTYILFWVFLYGMVHVY